MNIHRNTTYPIPSRDEKNTEVIVRKFTDCILMLAKRDEDKEKRIRVLEDELKKGFVRRLREWFIGKRWKIVETGDDSEELQAQRLDNGTWVPKGWFS